MTREEAKSRAELYSALAEGKTIQVLSCKGEWIDIKTDELDYLKNYYKYRIKLEPKYRPFKTKKECWNEMHKHLDFGWLREKESGYLFNTIAVFDSIRIKENAYNYSLVFKRFEFLDGAPFGVKEE